jgi:hypothetical protein
MSSGSEKNKSTPDVKKLKKLPSTRITHGLIKRISSIPLNPQFYIDLSLLFKNNVVDKIVQHSYDFAFGFKNPISFPLFVTLIASRSSYLRDKILSSPKFYSTLGGSVVKIASTIRLLLFINKKLKEYLKSVKAKNEGDLKLSMIVEDLMDRNKKIIEYLRNLKF